MERDLVTARSYDWSPVLSVIDTLQELQEISAISARTITVWISDMQEIAINLLSWMLEIWVWVFDLDAPYSFG